MPRKQHAVTAGMVHERIQRELRASTNLMEDAMRSMYNIHGSDSPPDLKLLAAIAGMLDSMVSTQALLLMRQFPDDDSVVVLRDCADPAVCKQPHVFDDDIQRHDDGSMTAIRIRHPAPDLTPPPGPFGEDRED